MKQRKIVRFVLPEVQRRLLAVALACIGSSVVISVSLVAIAMNGLAGDLPNDGDAVFELMPQDLCTLLNEATVEQRRANADAKEAPQRAA